MTNLPPIIAVLDDEPQMRKALGRLLRTYGFAAETYSGGRELMDSLETQVPDCLLLDLHMPDMNGFETMEALHASESTIAVIVITGHDEPGYQGRLMALGACAYLTKPVDEAVLLQALHQVFESKAGGKAP